MNNNKLKLSKELYGKDSILFSIEQYKDLSTIKVLDRGKYWECVFSKCCYAKDTTMKEFENYLINLTNVRGQ